MKATRIAAVAAVIAGAAVGLASPASAEALNGTYTGTVINGGGHLKEGATMTITFTSCGTDCSHIQTQGGAGTDLHLQGDTWSGIQPWIRDQTCNVLINKDSLVYTLDCPADTFAWQLAKNG